MAEKTPRPQKWCLAGLGRRAHFSTNGRDAARRHRQLILSAYFNRKLFVTTVTLESAMAADASIGESRPSAATGMPITL